MSSRQVLQSHTCVISHDAECTLVASHIIASGQLVSSIKGMFVQSLNTRKITWVSMVNPFRLNSIHKPKDFHQLNQLHHSTTQEQQYIIVLRDRYKLREPWSTHTLWNKVGMLHMHSVCMWFVNALPSGVTFTNRIQTSWMCYNKSS